MNERYAQYLMDLRIRHAGDIDALRRALAGRRPGLLRALGKNYRTIEAETKKIFAVINRRQDPKRKKEG